MLARRRLRLAASGGVFLALVGVWLGHTVEYVRVAGTTGLRDELTGSIHWYMAPVGAALAAVAAVAAVAAWRLWARLGDQLAAVRRAVARAWRGGQPADARRRGQVAVAPPEPRMVPLWPLLAAVQVGLYLLQENVEAVSVGAPAPGLGALTGRHWAAGLVHAAVALLLAATVVLVRRAIRLRSGAVRSSLALLGVLLTAIARAVAELPGAPVATPRPADRFGRLWCRPPPPLLVTG